MIIEEKKILEDAIIRLVNIMDDLREKCPWDKVQTIETLRTLTLEEVYELGDALLKQDDQHIKEELGDVLLHIVFYARILRERNIASLADVIHSLCEKLIRRHPHIYSDVVVENAEDVKKNWERIKQGENKRKKGLLSGVPIHLPALIKAFRIQQKAKQVGFEWEKIEDVYAKVIEEQEELNQAIISKDFESIEVEFGDLLFALVNYGRFLGIDPERSLELVNQKFISRFEYMEDKSNHRLSELTLTEKEELWVEAKKKLKK